MQEVWCGSCSNRPVHQSTPFQREQEQWENRKTGNLVWKKTNMKGNVCARFLLWSVTECDILWESGFPPSGTDNIDYCIVFVWQKVKQLNS